MFSPSANSSAGGLSVLRRPREFRNALVRDDLIVYSKRCAVGRDSGYEAMAAQLVQWIVVIDCKGVTQ